MKPIYTFKKFLDNENLNVAKKTTALQAFAYQDIRDAQKNLENRIAVEVEEGNDSPQLKALLSMNLTISNWLIDNSRLFKS